LTGSGSLTLADLREPFVELACTRCDRRGRLARERLVAEHGEAVKLPDLRVAIANCPRKGKLGDACGVYFVALAPGGKL